MSWYVVETMTGREAIVAKAIGEMGLDVFSPIHIKRLTRRGKRVQRELPLLPGYLFVSTEAIWIALRPILDVKHVRGILRGADSDDPMAVADSSIRLLRDVEADTNRVQRFGPGDLVLVVDPDHLRAGKTARILRLDNRGRIVVEESGNVRPYSLPRTSVEIVAGVTIGNPDSSAVKDKREAISAGPL